MLKSYKKFKKISRRNIKTHLTNAAKEDLAGSIDFLGIALHDVELAFDVAASVLLVDSNLGSAIHLDQVGPGLREEGLASPVLCESGRTYFPDPAVRLFSLSGS